VLGRRATIYAALDVGVLIPGREEAPEAIAREDKKPKTTSSRASAERRQCEKEGREGVCESEKQLLRRHLSHKIQDAAAEKIFPQENGTMSVRLQAPLQSKITLDVCVSKIRENEKRILLQNSRRKIPQKSDRKNPREPKTNPRRLPPFFTVRSQLRGANEKRMGGCGGHGAAPRRISQSERWPAA
jgi:hypothetical protein